MELLALHKAIKKPPRSDERDGELFCGTPETLRLVLNPYINDGYQAVGAECVCIPLQFLKDCGYTKYKCVERSAISLNAYYSDTGRYGYDLSNDLSVGVEKVIDYSDMSKYFGIYISMQSQDRTNRYGIIEIY